MLLSPSAISSSIVGSQEDNGNCLQDVAGYIQPSMNICDLKPCVELDGFPSIGSSLHESGDCKPCCFSRKGRCQNERSCQFCHYSHDKPTRSSKGKSRKARDIRGDQQTSPEDHNDHTTLQYGEVYHDAATANFASADSPYGQLQGVTPDDGISDNMWLHNSIVGFSDGICTGSIQPLSYEPPAQARHRDPCTSPTCVAGILPRCPLCGRLREGACGHPWLDILASINVENEEYFYEEITPMHCQIGC